MVPLTSLRKELCPEDADESSDAIYMNLFVGFLLTGTDEPETFLLLSWVVDLTVLDIWRLVGMLAIFLADPFSSLISMYLNFSMVWKLTGLGCLLPQTKHF